MSQFEVWIVAYNSSTTLPACVASLPSDVSRVRILDNGSMPQHREALERLAASDSRVTATYSDANLGFAGGLTQLSEGSTGAADDVIWILNPDTVVDPGGIQGLLEGLRSRANVIVSPVIYSGSTRERTAWFAGGSIDVRRGQVRHTGFGLPLEDLGTSWFATEFMSGAAPLLTRGTWQLLDGVRTDLFLYWEDVDLSLRAQDLGVSLWIDPTVMVRHDFGASSRSASDVKSETAYYYQNRNRVVVCTERTGRRRWLWSSGLIGTIIGISKPLRTKDTRRVRKSLACARGAWDGYKTST